MNPTPQFQQLLAQAITTQICGVRPRHNTTLGGGEEREDAQIAVWKDAWEFEFLLLVVSSLLPQE